jgi:hypothetical protein
VFGTKNIIKAVVAAVVTTVQTVVLVTQNNQSGLMPAFFLGEN